MVSLRRLALFFSLSAALVFGQVDRADLNGTVTDTSGSLVPGARVELASPSTGLTRDVVTGPSGVYSIPGIPIGTYDLKISKDGFRTFRMKNVQLFVGQSRTVDAKLELGTIATQVEVQAQAAASRPATRRSVACLSISNWTASP